MERFVRELPTSPVETEIQCITAGKNMKWMEVEGQNATVKLLFQIPELVP